MLEWVGPDGNEGTLKWAWLHDKGLAMHCNALQRTATHCNALQRTATHCNILQRTATHCNILQHTVFRCNALQRTAAHCSTLQHAAAHCSTLQHSARHCNTLQHAASHCNAPGRTIVPCLLSHIWSKYSLHPCATYIHRKPIHTLIRCIHSQKCEVCLCL